MLILTLQNGEFGEVVNTADCGPVMRGFDSHISPHCEKIVAYATFFIELNMLSLFKR